MKIRVPVLELDPDDPIVKLVNKAVVVCDETTDSSVSHYIARVEVLLEKSKTLPLSLEEKRELGWRSVLLLAVRQALPTRLKAQERC